jgi:hypothetical protein
MCVNPWKMLLTLFANSPKVSVAFLAWGSCTMSWLTPSLAASGAGLLAWPAPGCSMWRACLLLFDCLQAGSMHLRRCQQLHAR